MIYASSLRPGANVLVNGQVYNVVHYQHHKPGKGSAVVRLRLRNVATSQVIDRTVDPEDKFEEAVLLSKPYQYLYHDENNCYFMDTDTYEQISILSKTISNIQPFLKDGATVTIIYEHDKIIAVELPEFVELKVIYTEHGIRGDRVSAALKSATLETNVQIKVPLFVEIGDTILVDTRTGEYSRRV